MISFSLTISCKCLVLKNNNFFAPAFRERISRAIFRINRVLQSLIILTESNVEFRCCFEVIFLCSSLTLTSVRSFKIVLVGEANVGKTSLLVRYCENTFTESNTTVDIDFKSKITTDPEGGKVKLNVWYVYAKFPSLNLIPN